MKRRTKYIGAGIASLLFFVMLVGATLLPNFGEVQTTIDAQQSVQIDGHNWDEPITHDFEGVGGCCYCFEHEVTNQGCEGIWLDWEHSGNPDMEGIDVTIIEKCYLSQLDVEVLDGIADDSFDVYVDGIFVYNYVWSGDTNEFWIMHNIDLTPFNILCYGTHTIKIDSTASQWQYWGTYGQLAVNTIDLYCEDVWCDGVDIGKPTSEAGHNLQSWGAIEPLASGGNYGGIDDCRVTWSPIECPVTSWATVDLTCDFCECTCEKEPMDLPFYLEPDEALDFCLCYKLDMLIAPGQYVVTSTLIPVIP